MTDILDRLSYCVEYGKIDKTCIYPANLKHEDGASELCKQALEQGISPEEILSESLMRGMEKVGEKFKVNKVFVPQVLLSGKAMKAAMNQLKPLLTESRGSIKGTFIIGTVEGDLHDIGKNLVSMIVQGNGYHVIDLGVDVDAERFIEEVKKQPGCIIGLSALLTTTMRSMENIVKQLKSSEPNLKICIGGAPVNEEFRRKIRADFYGSNPHGIIDFLNKIAS